MDWIAHHNYLGLGAATRTPSISVNTASMGTSRLNARYRLDLEPEPMFNNPVTEKVVSNNKEGIKSIA